MVEGALTINNLSQKVLDQIWLVWYRNGYQWDRDYPCCAPTPGMVRTYMRGNSLEWRVGLSDYRPAAIRIEKGFDATLTFIAIARIPDSFNPEEARRIRNLTVQIMDKWREAGIPTLPEEAVEVANVER